MCTFSFSSKSLGMSDEIYVKYKNIPFYKLSYTSYETNLIYVLIRLCFFFYINVGHIFYYFEYGVLVATLEFARLASESTQENLRTRGKGGICYHYYFDIAYQQENTRRQVKINSRLNEC